eukprot:359358-Chlamydomonas_euryale.AAC.3
MSQTVGRGCTESEANRVPKPRMRRPNWPGGRGAQESPRGNAFKAILDVEKGMDAIPEGHDNPTLSTLEVRAGTQTLS